MQNNNSEVKETLLVPWYGYLILFLAIIFFSGIFATNKGFLSALDFNSLAGNFGGVMSHDNKPTNFVGAGGLGARQGFLFALTLFPGVMLAMGAVEVISFLGGLTAAQKILTIILKPLIGVPGIASLALISSLQSTDAGAGMTKQLRDNGQITAKERVIFISFQFTAGAVISNYFSSGTALYGALTVPIIYPLAIIFLLKLVGTNIARLYVARIKEEDVE